MRERARGAWFSSFFWLSVFLKDDLHTITRVHRNIGLVVLAKANSSASMEEEEHEWTNQLDTCPQRSGSNSGVERVWTSSDLEYLSRYNLNRLLLSFGVTLVLGLGLWEDEMNTQERYNNSVWYLKSNQWHAKTRATTAKKKNSQDLVKIASAANLLSRCQRTPFRPT